MILTEDPSVVIEDLGAGWVVYRALGNGERWIIHGVCNRCGECEMGREDPNLIWTGVPVGQLGACLDKRWGTRRDIPVRPEIRLKNPHCTLSGEYLAGG